ncbi:hypothetical protein [Zobellia uliginosa]|uniref:hypothetical protein n=1 Tax=Zobellia uliginosa TaxID=143224 RepID=UPI0026E1CB0C|nr:hypothetical protein [Zobellia uliginosa]MDO6516266.1 hypothetical protein [Zobellia uliginosa]
MMKNRFKTWSSLRGRLSVLVLLTVLTACSKDADTDNDSEDKTDVIDVVDETDDIDDTDDTDETDETEGGSDSPCTDVANYIFKEKNGLVNVEFENAQFPDGWVLKSDGDSFTGKGYMVWEGDQYLGNPGNGKTSFKIEIKNTGTYRFLWKSAVKSGNSGSDHNDTWLRFNDADDFYAQKDDSIVYPKDTGKTPHPEGASKDGWFKIYRSGSNLDFKWQSSTFDNKGHNIYVVFEKAGVYTMEISARSSGHGIDRFVLFNDAMAQADAISDDANLSETRCN